VQNRVQHRRRDYILTFYIFQDISKAINTMYGVFLMKKIIIFVSFMKPNLLIHCNATKSIEICIGVIHEGGKDLIMFTDWNLLNLQST
jgi:hypothetical protein